MEIPDGTPCDASVAAFRAAQGEPDRVLFDEPGIRVTGLPAAHFLELLYLPGSWTGHEKNQISAVFAWGAVIGDGCARSVTYDDPRTQVRLK